MSKKPELGFRIYFEPRQRDGLIICHRKWPNGEPAQPIKYDADSSHPVLANLSDEEKASWIAARDIMGWPDRSRKMTHFA
jgi:hypothetical protein